MKSLKSRLLVYLLIASTIPIVAFLVYTMLFVSDGLVDSEIESNQTMIEWSEQYLEELAKQLEDIVYSVHLEPDLLTMVDNANTSYDDIEEITRSTLYNNSNILSKVTVISVNTMRGVSFDYENSFVTKNYMYDDFYIEDNSARESLKFVSDGSETYVLHTINNFETKALEGVILLRLNSDAIEEIKTIFGENSNYLLYSTESTIVNTKDYDYEPIKNNLKAHITKYYQTSDTFYWTKQISDYDLYITLIVLEAEVQAFSRNMIGVGLIIIFSSLVITFLVSLIISKDITSPIIQLVSHMKKTKLEKLEKTEKGYDEITILEMAYNQMIDEINLLIEQQYRSEIDRQNIQLKALQAQINPHFLSNTFQLIGGMALEQGASDIYDATIKMSQLVRYSMRIEQNAVTLNEELIHIKDYLDIQKLRFGDRLHYEVDIDPSINTIEVPKFTLQPIIENAFKHGFKKINRPWQINITAKVSNKDVYIYVKDNGKGLETEKIKEINDILTSKSSNTDSTSIGISNISSRLKLLYGSMYGLSLKNNEGNGITVIIHLPNKGALI